VNFAIHGLLILVDLSVRAEDIAFPKPVSGKDTLDAYFDELQNHLMAGSSSGVLFATTGMCFDRVRRIGIKTTWIVPNRRLAG
jgi:hypothetical protein